VPFSLQLTTPPFGMPSWITPPQLEMYTAAVRALIARPSFSISLCFNFAISRLRSGVFFSARSAQNHLSYHVKHRGRICLQLRSDPIVLPRCFFPASSPATALQSFVRCISFVDYYNRLVAKGRLSPSIAGSGNLGLFDRSSDLYPLFLCSFSYSVHRRRHIRPLSFRVFSSVEAFLSSCPLQCLSSLFHPMAAFFFL